VRRLRKKYKSPLRPWNKERMDKEDELIKFYGLKKKREIWRIEEILRNFRRRARELAARKDKAEEETLLNKLYKMGLLEKGASLDDVLSLTPERLLERRLQTVVLKKGLANTAKQSRQFITHGHIAVKKRRTVYPNFLVSRGLEKDIEYFKKPLIQKKVK